MTPLAALVAQPAQRLARLDVTAGANQSRTGAPNAWDNRPSWDNWRKHR